MAGNLTLSVSQLNEYVRRMFQLDPMLARIDLKGEISNLKFHQSGMLFFTLKDDLASVACAMSADDAQRLATMPFDGMRVIVSGSVGLYARSGRYQFYASSLRSDGLGTLYERLMRLKSKLSEEGLFDQEKKKPVPGDVDTVGVVSSPTGAVIHDICHVALRRDPQARILLCPARVQGPGAEQEVAHAIGMLDRMENVSVIIVARGGGSMEDLWTFNEESVVRAIARCRKPVVSAVGHETDVTLSDLAADLRAPTPSAAAECVFPIRADMIAAVRGYRDDLQLVMRERLRRERLQLGYLQTALQASMPERLLDAERAGLVRLKREMREAWQTASAMARERLAGKKKEIQLLSPYEVLSRGYAIVLRQGDVIERAGELKMEDQVKIRFADGMVHARVTGEAGQTGRDEIDAP